MLTCRVLPYRETLEQVEKETYKLLGVALALADSMDYSPTDSDAYRGAARMLADQLWDLNKFISSFTSRASTLDETIREKAAL